MTFSRRFYIGFATYQVVSQSKDSLKLADRGPWPQVPSNLTALSNARSARTRLAGVAAWEHPISFEDENHFPPKDGSDDQESDAWLNSVSRNAVF